MSENTEKKALVDVEINATEALENLTRLRVRVDELREAQKKQDKSTEEGRLQYEALGQQIKILNKDAQKYQYEILKSAQATRGATGSIEQMEAELSKLKIEYKRIGKDMLDSDFAKEQKKHIFELTEELKKLEHELGDDTRKVGSYEEAIKNALSGASTSLGDLKKRLAELKNVSFAGKTEEEINKIKAAISATKEQIEDVTNEINTYAHGADDNLALIVSGLNAVVGSVTTLGNVLGLAGVEAEWIDKIKSSTTNLIGVMQSLTVISEFVEKQQLKAIATRIVAIATTIKATAVTARDSITRGLNVAFIGLQAKANGQLTASSLLAAAGLKIVTAVTWLWNAALASNPIMIFVIALAALVAGIAFATEAFAASVSVQKRAENAQKGYEMQLKQTTAAVEKLEQAHRDAQTELEHTAQRELQDLKRADQEKRAIYDEEGKLVALRVETEEQRVQREEALRKELAAVEKKLAIDTASLQIKTSQQIVQQKENERVELEKNIKAQQEKLNTIRQGSKDYKEQAEEVDKLLKSHRQLNKELSEENAKEQQARITLTEADLKEKDERIKAAKEAAERSYTATMNGYKREQQLSEARLKSEAGYLSKKFSDKQDYEEKLFTLSESSNKKQLKLQRDNKKITEEEYKAQLALMTSARQEFNNKQAAAANDYYIQQVAAIKKLMGDNLTEQIADVERQYKEAVKQLGEIKPPTQKGLSDEEFKAQTAAYEAMVMKQTETEIVLGREKDKKIAELKRNSLQARAAEVEKSLTEEYQDDFDKYADNEREKLRLTTEMLQTQIEKKREAGLSTAADEAKLRSAQSGATQLALAQDLQRANLSAKERYDLKMAALDKEQELYKDNAEKIKEIERDRTETERELTLSRIEAVEQWASRSMEVANELNNLMNALNEAALQEAQDEADQKTAASDERRAAEQAKLDAEMKQNEARMQKDAKYKAAMEKKQADLDKKYADEKANIDYELAKQQAEIARDQAKREKALSIFQIAIDTAMSIAKTSATLGYPAAIPFVIAAGVLGALQTATVLATPLPEIPEPPKAARGRLIKGKSHRLGGEVVEAEAGEAIINKRSTSMFAPLLSAINEAGGGIPFTAPMSDGGYMYREAERSAPIDMDAMRSVMIDAVKEIKVYTTIEDIRRQDKNYTEIENNTSV